MRRVELWAVAGLSERTSPEFRAELVRMCERLGLEPSTVAAVMAFETNRTFSPGIRNPLSGAVGLIQFTEDAAAAVGSTREALGVMTALEQLRYVEAYFKLFSWRIHSTEDHYLAVFAPRGLGRAGGYALYVAPSKAYKQNRPLDVSRDGTITVAEACAPVLGLLAQARGKPPIVVELEEPSEGSSSDSGAGGGLVAALVLGLAGLLARSLRRRRR